MEGRARLARNAVGRLEKSFSSNAARFTVMPVSAKEFNFAERLLAWHRVHGRHDLPWQQSPADPYKVWVSEIMLQQTQVATVIPYFERFMQRFASLQALAAASEQEVLAFWSGLGYYQRARNLHACAKKIVHEHGGQFPQTAQDLQSLPGIGRSTAAAIAATVFRERVAILDGNVKRVLARITRADAPWQSPALERLLWQEAAQRLPKAGKDMPAYTQAIMDLGALVCRAREPLCKDCPVAAGCLAQIQGEVSRYPLPKAKKVIPTRNAYWAVLLDDQGVWLQQRPGRGIWPGLWAPWHLDLAKMPGDWRRTASGLREVIHIRHSFTHYHLEIEAGVIHWHAANAPVDSPQGLEFIFWKDVFALALPSPVRALLLRLCPSETKSGAERHRHSGP
jgi:A/G-specific adenine glycosylase